MAMQLAFDLATVTAGLAGSLIGAAAAIVAQIVTQRWITDREAGERARREDRVRALFAARAEAAASVAEIGAVGMLWSTDQILQAVAPLDALSADTELSLSLDPKAIRAVTEALVAIKLSIRTAGENRDRYEERIAAQTLTGEERVVIDDKLRRSLSGSYKIGFDALNALLRALGAEPVATELSEPRD